MYIAGHDDTIRITTISGSLSSFEWLCVKGANFDHWSVPVRVLLTLECVSKDTAVNLPNRQFVHAGHMRIRCALPSGRPLRCFAPTDAHAATPGTDVHHHMHKQMAIVCIRPTTVVHHYTDQRLWTHIISPLCHWLAIWHKIHESETHTHTSHTYTSLAYVSSIAVWGDWARHGSVGCT